MALIPKKTKYRLSFRNKTKKTGSWLGVKDHKRSSKSYLSSLTPSNAWFEQVHVADLQEQAFELNSRSKHAGSFYDHLHQGCFNFLSDAQSRLSTPMTSLGLLSSSALKTKSLTNGLANQITKRDPILSWHRPAFDHLLFGTVGIYFLEKGTVTTKYIETIRLLIARKFKKKSRFWIRLSTSTPVTARPAETRMGKGKGSISHWEAKVQPGQIFLEFSGVESQAVEVLFKQICSKSALPLQLVYK